MSETQDKLTEEQLLLLQKGLDEFNTAEFFDCHETLEELWQGYLESDRELIQGIIQIAVAYYHVTRGNPNGAVKLMTRGLARVKNYLPNYFQLSLEDFFENVSYDLANLKDKTDVGIADLRGTKIYRI